MFEFLSILLAVLFYGLVHSWLASLGLKAWAVRRFGAWAQRSYRFLYNLFAVVSFLPLLALVATLPDRELYGIPHPWTFLALLAQGLAGVILLLGVLQTGLSSFLGLRQLYSDNQPEQSKLVVSGFYRWVRHPLYTAGLVFIWLLPLMSCNILALNLGLTGYILIGAWLEERKLLHEYGQEYADYARRTPMLVPDLTAWFKQ